MSNTVIQAENLSKLYRLGSVGTGSLANDLNRAWYRLRGKEDPYLIVGQENDRTIKGTGDFIWALKDVGFRLEAGEVLGVIGKNGAGKSTLLKILSRTTSPTTGNVKLKGRVASLLEVGTGFHPELSGRENIFLNGSILGMHKYEIKQKFDEIVAFSGVERYIDTPVKRYSSGMYVRLAFAVAAHLEADIMIIDEVLAVGDQEFQKKALGKMKAVSSGNGRTVIFVSHNMQAISTLTKHSLYLKKGKLEFIGETNEVITKYLSDEMDSNHVYRDEICGTDSRITSVIVSTSETANTHIHGDPLEIEVEVFLKTALIGGNITIQLFNMHGIAVTHFWVFDSENEILRKPGLNKLKCIIPNCRLFYGRYTLTVFLTERSGRDRIQMLENICPFDVEMFKSERDHPWQRDTSMYLDEFYWET